MISREDVKHMADLAKLKFSEKELDDFTGKFSEILSYVEQLNEVDTENVEPTYQVNEHYQTLREDVSKEGLTKEEVLENSPETQYGYFKVLRIVE